MTRGWFLVTLVVPVAALFTLPVGSADAALVWLIAIAMTAAVLVRLAAGPAADPFAAIAGAPRMLAAAEVPEPIAGAMDVRIALQQGIRREFRGPLKVPPAGLVAELSRRLGGTAKLEEDRELGARISLACLPRSRGRRGLRRATAALTSLALFAAAFLSTAALGALGRGGDPLAHHRDLLLGLPYALVMMLVFLAHALGRSLALARHGEPVSPPFFIPLPMLPGTAGAVVRSQPRSRAALFDGAFGGLVAALAIGLPLLYLGLRSSPVVVAPDAGVSGTPVGSSILLAGMARLAIGSGLAYGDRVLLTPAAAAAWLAMLVLALRLVPFGALDGGAMLRALLGSRAGRAAGRAIAAILLVLAVLGRASLVPWLVVALLCARGPAAPSDDVTPVGAARGLAAFLAFALLGLIVIPLPDALHQPAGIHVRLEPASMRTMGL